MANSSEETIDISYVVERPIDHSSFRKWGFTTMLGENNLIQFLRELENPRITNFDIQAVSEFYLNLRSDISDKKSDAYAKVIVHGKPYDFNPKLINHVMFTNTSGNIRFDSNPDALANVLTGGRLQQWPEEGIKQEQLSMTYRVLHEIGSTNWYPITDNFSVGVDEAELLCSIVCRSPFNFGEFIYQRMVHLIGQFPKKIYYPCLVYELLLEQGYTPDGDAILWSSHPESIKVSREILFDVDRKNDLEIFSLNLRCSFDNLDPRAHEIRCLLIRLEKQTLALQRRDNLIDDLIETVDKSMLKYENMKELFEKVIRLVS